MRIMLDEEEIPFNGSTIFKGISIDSKAFLRTLSDKLVNNISKPMRDMAFPRFSTTTKRDRLAAAAIMNSASEYHVNRAREHPLPKERLSRENKIGPGFPSVTLLGDRKDWKRLAALARKILNELGTKTRAWYAMLEPILSRMYRSFDKPDGTATKEFWLKAARFSGGGETETGKPGPIYLSVSRNEYCTPRCD